MRVLVLGATGMLGHQVLRRLGTEFDTFGTARDLQVLPRDFFPKARLFGEIHAGDLSSIEQAIWSSKPDVIINCIGIVKQIKTDDAQTMSVNALLPHRLAEFAAGNGARLVHFSTDCVFSGLRGNYSELDKPDPIDLYGRSKLLGEIEGPNVLTLRLSVIGHELRHRRGLLEWFLSQRHGEVSGYARAFYSGLTTNAVADLLSMLLRSHADLEGIWHVGGPPITKYALLQIINEIYGTNVRVDSDESFVCDRRLDSARFRARTGWQPPTWEAMVQTMFNDARTSAVYS